MKQKEAAMEKLSNRSLSFVVTGIFWPVWLRSRRTVPDANSNCSFPHFNERGFFCADSFY